ncbi:MAG: Endoglucanase E precursor [Firmicutes bacterium ADurb.Bin419]|nr:MAG: Endoglucanase E precursor [Firmicutes bacterium ADurb.Bin419]
MDGNGNVNSIDLGYMKQFLLGMIKDFPAERGMLAADVDDNDEVNSIDFGLMRQYFLGIIKEFPCQPYK